MGLGEASLGYMGEVEASLDYMRIFFLNEVTSPCLIKKVCVS